jgi:3-phenylpropionate/cinnamic acid dioxygenase small subunit
VIDERAVERFLIEEAELLDAGDYDSWFALFTEDARYWVPSHPAQTDPVNDISLYYEDRALMHARIGRLRHPRAMGLPVRTSHLLGNIRITGRTECCDLVVHSRFQMLEFVDDEQRLHGGAVTHHLVSAGETWRIRLKRVDLVNAGGVFDLLQGFF